MKELKIVQSTESNIKVFELIEDDTKYRCEIQIDKKNLDIFIYYKNKKRYKGNIHLYCILHSLDVHNYSIKDIFVAIYILNNNKFKLIKESDKYKLRIECNILNKKKYKYRIR